MSALCTLLTTPYALLLATFYAVRPTTLLLTSLANLVSVVLPFFLLRPLSPPHHASKAAKGTVRNRSILTDPWTTMATSILATAIFAVLLELSFATFLPTWLVTYFDGIRDLSVAHLGPSGLPGLLVALAPAGYAAMEFLFASSTAAAPPLGAPPYVFDTERAGFFEHVYHNAWGWYTARQKKLIWRTAVLGAMLVGETVIQVSGTIKGVEPVGALGYAGVWGLGIVVLGAVFDWVGGPSG